MGDHEKLSELERMNAYKDIWKHERMNAYKDIWKHLAITNGLEIEWVSDSKIGSEWHGSVVSYNCAKKDQEIIDEILAHPKRTSKAKMLLDTGYEQSPHMIKLRIAIYFCFVPELKSILQINADHFDFATTLEKDTIDGLLDGQGSCSLLDFHPRIVPKGYTPEYFAVRSARISLGAGLKDVKADTGLLRYLFTNKHTSPLEMCGVTLALKVPIAIAVHFLRHRTGKFNQFSQRYAEVPADFGTYNPLNYKHGIRVQGGLNKQAGQEPDQANLDKITALMKSANEHQKAIEALYHEMVQETKVASEVARFWLPQSQFTMLIMQFDLNNLIKLMRLRIDVAHAQRETADYTTAIYELCKPLFPTIFAAFDEERFGLSLTNTEVQAFSNQAATLNSSSKTEKEAFMQKSKRLRIDS